MSSYNWTVGSLTKALGKVRRLIENATNEEEKYYYLKVYDSTSHFIFSQNADVKCCSALNEQDKFWNMTCAINAYGTYYTLIEQIYSKTKEIDEFAFGVTDAINSRIKEDKNFTVNTGAYLSHDKAIGMAKDFYERLDPELFRYFINVYDRRYSSFRFFKPCDGETSNCLFIDGAKRSFIDIENSLGVKKYADVVHEMGHSISFQMNPRLCYDDNDNFYDEVPSMFPEIVALYEGFDTELADDYLYTFFCSLAALGDDISLFMLHQPLAFAWCDNHYKGGKEFYKKMSKKFDMNYSDYDAALNASIERTGSYITSFGVSMELLHLYKKDKDKALKLFKEIINIPIGVNPNSYVLSRVPLGDGMVEELDIFRDKFTLSLKKKGIRL